MNSIPNLYVYIEQNHYELRLIIELCFSPIKEDDNLKKKKTFTTFSSIFLYLIWNLNINMFKTKSRHFFYLSGVFRSHDQKQ